MMLHYSTIPVFAGNEAAPFPGIRERKMTGIPGRPGMITLVVTLWHHMVLIGMIQQKLDQYCVILLKWRKIGCRLLLFTNRKSHPSFSLVAESGDLVSP